MGTIVRDSTLIVSTVKKMGWNVDLLGQVASYDTAVASAPGGVGEGFYSMTPALYAYPDDPRPAVHDFASRYKAKYGIDVNFLGETGYTSAQIILEALKRAGRDLNVDSFTKAMESIHDFHDIFGNSFSFGPNQHHGATSAYPGRGEERPLGAGGRSGPGLLSGGEDQGSAALLHLAKGVALESYFVCCWRGAFPNLSRFR